MLDFPNSPTVGYIFTHGNSAWVWDGAKWVPTAGPTTPHEYNDGIFIDARGTGTLDDTALWQQAITDAQNLGYYKIYMCRPSNVRNLIVTGNIEIIGVHGVSIIRLCASALPGGTDYLMWFRGDYVTLRNLRFEMPVYDGRDAAHLPPGQTALLFETGGSAATSVPHKHIVLDQVTTVGSNSYGIVVAGADRIDITNCECLYASGFGLVLGANLPIQKVRVSGFRAVACGSYGLCIVGFGAATNVVPFNNGLADMIFEDIQLINCGHFGQKTGFDAGGKAGCDLTGNSYSRLRGTITAVNCYIGGIEIKYTVSPPANVVPKTIHDVDVRFRVIQDRPTGYGVWLGLEGDHTNELPPGSMYNIRLGGSVWYRGGGTWTTGTFYETCDIITNAGNMYQCWGNANHVRGQAGALGPPTGTGTNLSSFYDGNLYWEYIGVQSAIPPSFAAMSINGAGSTTRGVLIENFEAIDCGYMMIVSAIAVSDVALRNVTVLNPIARNCNYGIYNTGNSYSLALGVVDNFHVINPDLDCHITCFTLGNNGSGSIGPISWTNAKIIGGRARVSGTGSIQTIRIEGPGVDLTISGDPYLSCNSANGGGQCLAATTGGPHTIKISSATFENEVTGNFPIQLTALTNMTLLGRVTAIQPDNTRSPISYGTNGSTVRGQISRGLTTASPQGVIAGQLSDTVYLDKPTATVSRYDCTTAGSSAAAVWTAKP